MAKIGWPPKASSLRCFFAIFIRQYNVIYSLERKGKRNNTTRKYTRRKNRDLRNKHIIQKTKDNRFVREWKDLGEIDCLTDMRRWPISECCSGNRKTAYGYKWEFAK